MAAANGQVELTADDGLLAAIRELIGELRAGRERPLLLTAGEAAALLGIGRTKFFAAVSAGELPRAYATPGGPRWKRAELERWAEKLKARVPARPPAAEPGGE